MVVQGAGWGGGSLIYANVHLRAPADLFQSGWPAGYSRAALDPYYDLVAYMLDIAPITASSHLGIPPKAEWMKEMAGRLGREAQFCYPNIAVDFSTPGVAHRNKFGVEQSGCTYCGECDIGCNVLAKNTLDLNYLAIAEQRGADVAPLCEVVCIERDGAGYRVTFKNHAAGGAERSPISQKSMPRSCASGASDRMSATTAPQPAATTTPVSRSRVGDQGPLPRARPKTIAVDANAPPNAPAGTSHAPAPSSIVVNAPAAAPPDTPNTYGSASEFLSST